jgi:signal transduction histidine kinase/DNA-binding response OmpR family regulator
MVLIVDDKAENIFSLKHTLESHGFEVDSALSGEEALKKILKQEYSLIILDVQMPGMDGFEVAETVSGYSKSKDIPIIFLSAVSVDKQFVAKGYNSGGIDYVTKPVDPDILLLKVQTLDRLYKQKRELKEIKQALLAEVAVRKKAEQELSKSVYQLQMILETLPQIAFTMKSDGTLEYANNYWYKYAEDLSALPEICEDDKDIYDDLHKALAAGVPFTGELQLKNRVTGAYRCHELKVMPVKHGKEVVKWVGSFTDIQEQKMANEQLETRIKERTEQLIEKNKQLEMSNYELQQFASVASHDLKEPLRKIQIFSSIIRDKYLVDTPDAKGNIKRVIEASQRMIGLINDLLNYSRLSVRSLFRKTDLKRIINDILGDLELSIAEKHAIVNVSEMPVIDAIPGQMRQVFQNLISNSLKFSRGNITPVININAVAESNGDGEHCCITIRDNGIGFNEKYLDKIFTIFQRLHPGDQYEGSGIGLAIVKKIIEQHKGTITARSEEGKGSTFTIVLPVRQQGVVTQATEHTAHDE